MPSRGCLLRGPAHSSEVTTQDPPRMNHYIRLYTESMHERASLSNPDTGSALRADVCIGPEAMPAPCIHV
jgi:hypothetical protein